MKKRHMILAAALCIVASMIVFAIAKHRAGALPRQSVADLRGQSLRERVKKNGSVTSTAQPTNLRRYDDVEALAKDSNVILIGTVDQQNSHLLEPAEKMVVTDFVVKVNKTFKGTVDSAPTITVRAPGGKVDFGDGTFAEVKLPEFWNNPEVGKSYVLFLEKRSADYYVLRGGPQGTFEVTSAGTIKPEVREEDQLMKRYNGVPARAFYEEVRRVIK